MTATHPAVLPFGDRAFLALLGDGVDEELNRRAHALADRVRAARTAEVGWGAPVPAYASVLVPFEPEHLDADHAQRSLEAWLRELTDDPLPAPEGVATLVEVPVRYGGVDGPDLPEVADRLGMTPAQVIEAHAAPTYRAYLLGFVPGFAYLGILPAGLALPRRPQPRVRVPAGSVAIAGRQTAVYPFATAGGWHLLGRTSLAWWDPERQPPCRVQPGDRVRFVPAGEP